MLFFNRSLVVYFVPKNFQYVAGAVYCGPVYIFKTGIPSLSYLVAISLVAVTAAFTLEAGSTAIRDKSMYSVLELLGAI